MQHDILQAFYLTHRCPMKRGKRRWRGLRMAVMATAASAEFLSPTTPAGAGEPEHFHD
jgi:hypothetical protein